MLVSEKIVEPFDPHEGEVEGHEFDAGANNTADIEVGGRTKTHQERLLGAHPAIRRGFENPVVENAVRQTFQDAALPTRERVVEMPPALDDQFRRTYRTALRRKAGEASVFTNTHPIHVYSALRLAHVLPEARFIFIERDRHDLALRIFFKLYRTGNSYAYGLEEIYQHIDWYYGMAGCISKHFPEQCLTLRYEAVVEDPERAYKAAAALCGLEGGELMLPDIGDDRGCSKPYRDVMSRT